MNSIPCTVSILTHNSGKTLARALESVKGFSEIIICDSGSTDNTLEIAHKYGALIITQDKQYLDKDGRIIDFAGVRNQCLKKSTQDWFFFLDSDEYCGEDLITAITNIIQENKIGAYFVNRIYVRGGVVIDCATTYPNRQMRFFARTVTKQFIKKIHERIQMKDGVVPKVLLGSMYIPLDDTIEQIRSKWDYYISIEVARHMPITWSLIFRSILQNGKVSTLYLVRLLCIWIFCRGKRMPFALEMERHRYHIQSIAAFWRAKLKK